MADPLAELIVYACPHGELGAQLDRYFAASLAECGQNTAHRFMPHVTLTGFFHDSIWSVRDHVAALSAAVAEAGRPGVPPATITEMHLRPDFHFLAVHSAWFVDVARRFRDRTTTRIRLKRDLHVSLAYEFAPELHERLAGLARELVDPHAPVEWTVRLYERMPNDQWTVHGAFPCPAS